MKNQYKQLMAAAKLAAKNAYAPYSKFSVGSAVLTDKDKVFTGANVENASFSLTNCAERVALQNAIAGGAKKITAIAVWTKKGGAFPCGACRQVILELAPEADIIVNGKKGELCILRAPDLMICAFSKKNLKK